MSVTIYHIHLSGNDYYTNDGMGGVPGTIAIGNYNSGDYNGRQLVNIGTDDSAIPLGGGAFLTAAHIFDAYSQSPVTNLTLEYRWTSADVNDSPVTGNVTELEPWNAQAAFNGIQTGQPTPDLAAFQCAAAVSSSDLSPLIVFTDPVSASQYLSNQTFSCSGLKTPYVTGSYAGLVAPGVFDVNVQTVGGDSGGAASILGASGVSYTVGVESYGGLYDTKYSYLNVQDYEAALNEIAAGTDFSGMAPDIIYGGTTANQLVRTGQRQASIITDGNNNIILAGSGGGLVNTGSGQNDVVFMPSADGQSDPGTTVVVTPGTMIIDGAAANDKLVMLTDRLYDSPSGVPQASDTSATIQLLGGDEYQRDADGQPVYGVNTNGDPSLGYSDLSPYIYDTSYAFVKQADGSTTLAINAQTFDNSGPYAQVLWNSSIDIVNYQAGDFGLKFTPDDDTSYGQTLGNMAALLAPSVGSTAVDDDPTQQWGIQDNSLNPLTQAQLSADLADVISNTQGSDSTLAPSPTTNPSDDGATASVAPGATLNVTGNDETIMASGAGSTLNFGGTDETASISSGTVALWDGSSVTLDGSSNAVTLYDGASLTLSGSDTTIAEQGNDDSVTISANTSGSANNVATITGTNDTAIITAPGTTLNIGGTGLVATIDAGILNIWNGSSSSVTGNSNDFKLYNSATLDVTGEGNNLDVVGAYNIISLAASGSNSNVATIWGQSNRVTATGPGATLDVGGTGEVLALSSGAVNMWDYGGAAVTGNFNNFVLYDSATLSVTGAGNNVSFTGTGSSVSLAASGAGVNSNVATVWGNSDSVSAAGSGATVNVAGTGETVAMGSGAVNLWDGSSGTLTGDSNAVLVYDGATLAVTGGGNTIGLQGTGSSISLSASGTALDNNIATMSGNNDSVTAAGSGATVNVAGTGETVAMASGAVNLWDGSAANVTGSGNALVLYDDVTLGVAGSSNSVTLSGTGSSVALSAGGSGTDSNVATVLGNGNRISASDAGATVQVGGSGETVTLDAGTVDFWNGTSAAVSGNTNMIVLNANDSVTASGSGTMATLQGQGDSLSVNAAQIAVTDGSSGLVSGSNDIVTFGGGASMTASGTQERFIFAATPANVTVNGYDASDQFQFSASTFANWNALLSHASQQGADTILHTDQTHSVTLANVALSALTQSQFHFL